MPETCLYKFRQAGWIIFNVQFLLSLSQYKFYDRSKLLLDESLEFDGMRGSRSGVCYRYPFYDCVSRKQMSFEVEPLTVMDSTFLDKVYLGPGATEEGHNLVKEVKDTCNKHCGVFPCFSIIRD